MRKRLIWAWAWMCWRVVQLLPHRFYRTQLFFLPWAGLYGFTDGGWQEFHRRDF